MNQKAKHPKFNALKHGLSVSSLVQTKVFKEKFEDFTSLHEGLIESFKPQNEFESALVATIASSLFKLRRIDVLEGTAFSDPDSLLQIRILEEKDSFNFDYDGKMELVLRYKASLENSMYRAFASLLQCRGPQQMDLFKSLELELANVPSQS